MRTSAFVFDSVIDIDPSKKSRLVSRIAQDENPEPISMILPASGA